MYVFSNEPIQMAFAETDRSAQLYESDFSFGYPMTERPYRNAKVSGRFADGHQVRMGFYCLTNGFRCDVYFLPPDAYDGICEPALPGICVAGVSISLKMKFSCQLTAGARH